MSLLRDWRYDNRTEYLDANDGDWRIGPDDDHTWKVVVLAWAIALILWAVGGVISGSIVFARVNQQPVHFLMLGPSNDYNSVPSQSTHQEHIRNS